MISRLLSTVRSSGALQDLAWLSGANLLVKPAWFLFITAACMRGLGEVGYGVFVSALAVAGIALALTELGVVEYATREIARAPARAPALFTNLMVGRLSLGAASCGLAAGAVYSFGYSSVSWQSVAFASVYVLCLRAGELCRALYRASDAFSEDAGSTLIERLLTIAAGVAALVGVGTPSGVLGGLAAGAAASVVLNLAWSARRHGALSPARLDGAFLRRAYAVSLPIGIFALATTLFHGVGPVLLPSLASEAAAGQYGAAWRLVELYMLAPSLVTAVALPRLSRRAGAGDASGFRSVLTRSAAGLGAGALVVALATAVGAPFIIRLMAGQADFSETAGLLRVLAFAFPLMSLSMLFSASLIADGRQWVVAVITAAAALAHGAACAVTIPAFGAAAVAFAMVGTYAAVVVVAGWVLIARPPPPAIADHADPEPEEPAVHTRAESPRVALGGRR